MSWTSQLTNYLVYQDAHTHLLVRTLLCYICTKGSNKRHNLITVGATGGDCIVVKAALHGVSLPATVPLLDRYSSFNLIHSQQACALLRLYLELSSVCITPTIWTWTNGFWTETRFRRRSPHVDQSQSSAWSEVGGPWTGVGVIVSYCGFSKSARVTHRKYRGRPFKTRARPLIMVSIYVFSLY